MTPGFFDRQARKPHKEVSKQMNDMGRAQIIWDCLETLEGVPTMEFNPRFEKVFITCLDIERQRTNDVIYTDRYMDIFEYCSRWAQCMELMLRENSHLTVQDVANNAAFLAGPDSNNTSDYLLTAGVILSLCWRRGDELQGWLKDSRYYDSNSYYFKDPHRLGFPLYYLHEPSLA